jgi:Bcr/CflA subfamily drug resistance transporter
MRADQPAVSLATLSVLCAFSILPLTIFLPSLPTIADDLQTDYALIALSLAGYTAMAAVFEVVTGPLSDRYGRKPILLGCLALFTIGSIGCAFATDIWSFLVFRLMQAAITTCFPIAVAIIKDTTEDSKVASRIGYASTVSAIAPMLGPGVGGVIDEAFGWRAIFWLLAAAGVGLMLWFGFRFAETNRSKTGTVGGQMRAYGALLREPRFWAYAVCTAFSSGMFHAYLVGAPFAARVDYDLSVALLGVFMGTTTLGYMGGSFLAGRYSGRFEVTHMLLVARLVALSGPIIALALFFLGIAHPLAFFAPLILVGIGNGLTGPNTNAGALTVRPDMAGSVSGLLGAMTIAGGAGVAATAGILVTEQSAAVMALTVIFGSGLLALGMALLAWMLERRLRR